MKEGPDLPSKELNDLRELRRVLNKKIKAAVRMEMRSERKMREVRLAKVFQLRLLKAITDSHPIKPKQIIAMPGRTNRRIQMQQRAEETQDNQINKVPLHADRETLIATIKKNISLLHRAMDNSREKVISVVSPIGTFNRERTSIQTRITPTR